MMETFLLPHYEKQQDHSLFYWFLVAVFKILCLWGAKFYFLHCFCPTLEPKSVHLWQKKGFSWFSLSWNKKHKKREPHFKHSNFSFRLRELIFLSKCWVLAWIKKNPHVWIWNYDTITVYTDRNHTDIKKHPQLSSRLICSTKWWKSPVHNEETMCMSKH